MKKLLLRVLAIMSVLAVAGAFLGYVTPFVLKLQPMPTVAFLVVLLLTPFAGRFLCAWICPLGVMQSAANWLSHPKSHIRRVCTRLPEKKPQLFMRWAVFAAVLVCIALGAGALGYALTPYSIVGKALIGFIPGLILFAAIIVLAMIGKGRFWCNWVCPAGTLFNLLARFAVRPHKIDMKDGCGNCRACFAKQAAKEKEKPAADEAKEGVSRREVLAGVALIAATEAMDKTTDGGYAPVSLPGLPQRPAEVLPPGAIDRGLFNRVCIGCGACIAACPEKCLVPSVSLKTFGQPQMDFRKSHCRLACPQRCAAVCPAGALKLRDNVSRRDLHMGHAIWKKERCIRETGGVECTACLRKCPVEAIQIVRGFPVIDKEKCIGCGACEHVCPARPLPAIFVKGFERQRVVRPFNVEDLIVEMKSLIVRGEESAVVAHDGVITAKAEGRGIMPLMKLLDDGKLNRGLVVDKVIGRAAAAICIVGRVRRVHGLLMSADAKLMLEERGILTSAEKVVPEILNRELNGSCPLEQRVATENDPVKMVGELRRFLSK